MVAEIPKRPVALVTGVGRTVGIGAGIALHLARDGWDVATTHWTPYDDRMPWGRQPDDVASVAAALTSDHTVHNLPYGASKGALDRIVIAAARELEELRITSNVINPGPIDTGWMSDELRERVLSESPRGRGGRPSDTAALVSFLCGEEGGWINGQLLYSDGGLHT